ncbi:hypothetical protein J7E81_01485 [Bacillus sp. ISL-18]|uniref:hypothetical protein n=1 Tax=Bacillus sp. ISL-18 TaxID=2819118 RepID=UPI001BE94DC0|nr:hypothetical protein [Bacillus sp. ISL-18]MBT2653918.1 hypothetical protein [Bacillus sp. ISL-18]
MVKITRKVVEGVTGGTVDTTGMSYAKLEGNVTAEYTVNGVTYSNEPGRLLLTNVSSLKIIGNSPWKVSLSNVIPAVNQSELKMAITGEGKLIIDGDQDLIYRGQDTDPATVSIAGIKDDLEQLSKLYITALGTGTVTDAAKYLKLKTAVLARYAN